MWFIELGTDGIGCLVSGDRADQDENQCKIDGTHADGGQELMNIDKSGTVSKKFEIKKRALTNRRMVNCPYKVMYTENGTQKALYYHELKEFMSLLGNEFDSTLI